MSFSVFLSFLSAGKAFHWSALAYPSGVCTAPKGEVVFPLCPFHSRDSGVSYQPQLLRKRGKTENEKTVNDIPSPCFKLQLSEGRIMSARTAAAGHGDQGTQDTKHRKQPGQTSVFGPVIQSEKRWRHLCVVTCQGEAVMCRITHGERGQEASGGREQERMCIEGDFSLR